MFQENYITKKSVFSEYPHLVIKYFSQVNITRKNILDDNSLPNCSEVISNIIDYEVISVRILETIKGVSYEGWYSSRRKALVDLKFREKIMYISDSVKPLVNIIEFEFYHTVPVIIPKKIEGVDIRKLIQKKLLRTRIEIEYSTVTLQNKRTFIRHLFLLLEIYKV